MIASACERKNADQLVALRCGAGSIPASFNIRQTVEAATAMPRMGS